jgi:tetratricopeptide (TPR) repeat protein
MIKNLLLALASSLVFFALLEGGLALVGISPALDEDDPFVGFSGRIPLFVEAEGPDGEPELVTAPNKRGFFNVQKFPRKKAPGGYRIFCVGGSTTYGRPYDHRTSFCGWLRVLLPLADPSRHWEVINAGGISYASYRVAALMEELVGYDPDLFIVYTGHNEFLERRTYAALLDQSRLLMEARALLNRTRTYTAMKGMIDRPLGRQEGETPRRNVLPAEVDAILDDSAGLSYYSRDNIETEGVLRHFRLNLERMIRVADESGVGVLIVTPASNLRHCSPFKSEHRSGLSDGERQRWRSLIGRARREHADEEFEEALGTLDRAAAVDDRRADLHYLRGQALDALGRSESAREAFERARDEDICPLRALSRTTEIVNAVAEAEGVRRVAFDELLTERSKQAIPGADYFLDHVHPTVDAHGLLARALVDAMIAEGVVRPAAGWPDEVVSTARRSVEDQIDRKAQGLALKNLAKVLTWAGKFEEAHRTALLSIGLIGGWHAGSHRVAGNSAARLGDFDGAEAHFRRGLRLQPDDPDLRTLLARVFVRQNRHEEAISELEKVIAQRPRFADAHSELGDVLRGSGQLDRALRHLKIAVRIEPNAENRLRLAIALVRAGRGRQAAVQLREVLRRDPGNARAHSELAEAFAQTGRFRDAVNLAEKAIHLATASDQREVAREARERLQSYRRRAR